MNTELHGKINHIIGLIQAFMLARERAKRELGYGDCMKLEQVFELSERVKREHDALHAFVNGLSDDEKRQTSAIMLLGRGDFGSCDDSLRHCETFPIETASQYILGKTRRLEKYLRAGMAKSQPAIF
jgi:predicted metal-dependent peptidase